jgi:molybdopterin converting factor small subunit
MAAFSGADMTADPSFALIELPNRPALRVPAGQNVLEALRAEGVEFPRGQALIAVANGQTVDLSYQLRAGDTVRLIPQIAGG